jgi:hypothetical protein
MPFLIRCKDFRITLSTKGRDIYGFERTIQRRDVSGLSVAYCASRIVPIPRGGKISISGHRLVQTILEAKERERARATTYLHSVAEAEIPTLSNGAREKVEKNIIGRLLTSLIQEEHAPAETTNLDDILLADQF